MLSLGPSSSLHLYKAVESKQNDYIKLMILHVIISPKTANWLVSSDFPRIRIITASKEQIFVQWSHFPQIA